MIDDYKDDYDLDSRVSLDIKRNIKYRQWLYEQMGMDFKQMG